MQRISLIIFLIVMSFPSILMADTLLYVQKNGSDSWTGNLSIPNTQHTDGPLASLMGARNAVRRLRARQTTPGTIRVIVGSGTYQMSEPALFEPEDSGTVSWPVVYEAAKGARPVFSGGREITGWKPGSNGIWQAKVPDIAGKKWDFSQLFVNGKRCIRARTPNAGYYRAVGRVPVGPNPQYGDWRDFETLAFCFKPGDIKNWSNQNDINVVTLHFWESCRMRIASVDMQKSIVRFTGGGMLAWWLTMHSRPFYYVENLKEALDAPNEWYLDRKTSTVFYKPSLGVDMKKAKVIASVLDKLLVMKGDPEHGRFIQYLKFQSLAFRYSDWHLEQDGHSDNQAARTVEASVQCDGVQNCSFEGCEISHIGTYGIWLRKGCTDNRIVQCEIADTGAGGVRIGEEGFPDAPECQTMRNTIHNSYIHDGGHIYPGAVAVWVGESPNNTITHNEICDHQYTGISVGWVWGYKDTHTEGTTIEYNHIHHLGQGILYDMGGIYTLGPAKDRIIRFNKIHDVYGGGIYLDEGSTKSLVEGNLLYRCLRGAIVINYGSDNILRNNILANCNMQQFYRNMPENHSSFFFDRNIVYYGAGKLFDLKNEGLLESYSSNTYWMSRGEPISFPGRLSFAEWQAKGKDMNSQVADPQFVDPARDDFRLKPGSPALKMGFEPIDLSKIGLVGDSKWTRLPKLMKYPKYQLSYFLYYPPDPIFADFENLMPGATALDAETLGESDKASVRVTDEDAATGHHSLKFVDAPDLSLPFNPHLVYRPYYTSGVARCSFDLKLESGAFFQYEWRDDDSPYHTGPSINIDPSGILKLSGKEVGNLPTGKWMHFEMSCELGKAAKGAYDLTITVSGEKPLVFARVQCSNQFNRLDYMGFISNATEKTVFYLDNLSMSSK